MGTWLAEMLNTWVRATRSHLSSLAVGLLGMVAKASALGVFGVAALGLSPPMLAEAPVVTQAGVAHDLPPALSRDASGHFVGTITYYDPDVHFAFLQDRTGGIFINTDKAYPMRQGDLVDLQGRINPSYRTEVSNNPVIRVLGRGTSFPAPTADYRSLASGSLDCRLVTIRGKVRDADIGHYQNAPPGHMDVVMPGGEVEIYVKSPANLDLKSLMDADVEITGVAGGSFDATWQMTGIILYVQDASAVHILHSPMLEAGKLPLTGVDDLLQARYVLDRSERIRVRGTVTYYKEGLAAVLETQGKSIYVETRQTANLTVGDVAEAYGFVSQNGYAPSLREALIVNTGERAEVRPRSLSYAEALSGLYSDNLISLSGILVSELHAEGTDTIVLNVDGHLVSAYLEGSAHIRDFAPGSRLRIAGICRVMPGNPWQAPYVFHLDLRSTADVVLLSNPPWWSIRHLVMVLSALAFGSCVLALCTMILRRRVLRQSGRIERSMRIASERTRILELISSNETPDVVLSGICDSVMTLLPGVDCSYFLSPQKAGEGAGMHPAPSKQTLFDHQLTGPDDEILGRLMVSATGKPLLSVPDQQEVYSILKELATLAIRQSLLYQGLLHHSTHDALTELANRRLCETKLNLALEEAAHQGGKLAVICIDINRFKQVNDRFGHRVGDDYLKLISARLLSHIRPSDTLARVGGDEFLVVAPLGTCEDPASGIAARLKTCFEAPFWIEGEKIEGSASFGVAIYPEHGITAEALKRKADHSMYLAKRSSRGTAEISTDIAIFTPEELSAALQKDMFRLAYQPQFSAQGRLTGLEVLLRLEDPILGVLTPDAFISAAERSDVILDIGAWTLRRALQDAMRWQLHTGDEICVAINVSERQMIQPDFASSVLACLQEQGFPADRLEIELIERSLLTGNAEVPIQLERLHQAGVRISLDDFGTGQSSLSILHRLPIDTIKLDRSFILAMDDEPKVLPIIQAIAFMATSLGKRIVAEGIEHVGPIPTLLHMAEMDFQGYLLGRPIPSIEADRLIGKWRSGIDMPAAFRNSKRNSNNRNGSMY